MKSQLRLWGKSAIIVFIAALLGTLSLIFIYALPVGRATNNARSSMNIYQREGNYPSWAPGKASAQLDNFTDSIMVRNAIFPGTGNLIEDAMLNPKTVTYSGKLLKAYRLLQEMESEKSLSLCKILAWVFTLFEAVADFTAYKRYSNAERDITVAAGFLSVLAHLKKNG